jgi:FKBP-type peptidyl-prolyl cis-trans isomerase
MRCIKISFILFVTLLFISASSCKPKYRTQEESAGRQYPDQESIYRANQVLIRQYANSISEVAARNGWRLSETGTGVFFQLINTEQKKQNQKIEKGDWVSLSYKLCLLDGTLCYSSNKQGFKQFIVEQSEAELGLHEAMKFLHPGDSARIVIPPQRAFGLTGDGNLIPPRAILVYEIRIDSVARHLNN